MQRVAANRNPAPDKFGAGKHGFTAGDPQAGVAATTPGAEFFDAVQEEIARTVEGSGATLDPTKFDQLLTAIKQLAWGNTVRRVATQEEAEAGADNVYQMTALRVAQAIATKVAQATEAALGVVKIATQALVDAGTDDATAVTPKKLRWGFSISKAANGYIAFPSWLGGLIIQWGSTSSTSVTFPTAFPTQCLRIVSEITSWNTTSAAAAQYFCVTGRTLTGFTLAGAATPQTLEWIAIGY